MSDIELLTGPPKPIVQTPARTLNTDFVVSPTRMAQVVYLLQIATTVTNTAAQCALQIDGVVVDTVALTLAQATLKMSVAATVLPGSTVRLVTSGTGTVTLLGVREVFGAG